MIPNFIKKKLNIKSPSVTAVPIGSYLLIGFRGGIIKSDYSRATEFRRPYTLPRFSSCGLEYAPLSAAVCAYDTERFYHTDEPVSVLKGGDSNAE